MSLLSGKTGLTSGVSYGYETSLENQEPSNCARLSTHMLRSLRPAMRPDSIDSLQPYLRHSFASRALALGESATMIGTLLGHTQVQTTVRYAHLARDSIQNAAARITESIGCNLVPLNDSDQTAP